MKVVFRTDASLQIGTGHVSRCVAMAARLIQSGAECHFVMRRLDGNMIAAVEELGIPVIALDAPKQGESQNGDLAHSEWLGVDWDLDSREMALSLVQLGEVDWIVVDHYALDARWERELRGLAKNIMAIDDLADRPHDCDILLDQNLQIANDRYSGLLPASAKKLVGPRFALLRPEFARARAQRRTDADKSVLRIFVYLGGVDLPGFTLKALIAIETIWENRVNVDVVIGAGNPHSHSITDWCQRRDWVNLYHGSSDIAQLMVSADMAVGAAGSASWERCCVGLPAIVVALADNQKPGGEAMGISGAAIYLGDADTLADVDLDAALRLLGQNSALRNHIAEIAASLVDGKGVDRLIRYMRGTQFALRLAGLDDCQSVWQWRNADENRRYAHNPARIAYADHQKWFTDVLRSSDHDLLIGEIDGSPIGVLRFDHEKAVSTISIYLVPNRSGKGEGTQLLHAGSKWLAEFRPAAAAIDAEILHVNKASRYAFLAAGYLPFAETLRYPLKPAVDKPTAEED